MSAAIQRIWLILTKVRVVSANPAGLTPSSESLVQRFIPETAIEEALTHTARLLQTQGMRRLDVLSCSSFERAEDEEGAPDFVKQDIRRTRMLQRGLIGTFFTSHNSSAFSS